MQSTRGGNTSRVGVITSTPPSTATATSAAYTTTTATTKLSENELIRREFYATYDVMTGIRIAATLGGFFGLVVILVVYKSKSKTEKALNDPYLAAVAAEAVAEAEADLQEEEEMALQAALEATAIWSMNPRAERTARRSLGNMSAPSTVWAPRSPRFSSVGGGGYANLLKPPIRSSYGGKSLPGSAFRFHTNYNTTQHSLIATSCHQEVGDDGDDDADDAFDELDDDFQFLNVNKRNSFRRYSNITCSSSDSSYLERRGSAVVGLPPPPALPTNYRRRSSGEKCCWDFYYPIDIQVIQPTPDMSPSSSERCVLYDTVGNNATLLGVRNCDPESVTSGLVVPSRLAPLATISSCASSVLGTDIVGDLDQRSVGSDSVFMDDNHCCYDTDDEITQFSTDSEEESLITPTIASEDIHIVPTKQYAWKRRSSAPPQRRKSMKYLLQQPQQRLNKPNKKIKLSKSSENIQLLCSCDKNSLGQLDRIEETCLTPTNDKEKYRIRPQYPLPAHVVVTTTSSASTSDTSTLIATNTVVSDTDSSFNLDMTMVERHIPNQEVSCQRLSKSSSSLVNIEMGGSSSQETLF